MNFASLLNDDYIFLDQDFNSSDELIHFVSEKFSYLTHLSYEEVKAILLKREEMGITYMGNGLMLPHGRIPNFKDIVIMFIRPKNPFEVTVNEKTEQVKYVFAILTCSDEAQLYLKILGSISQIVKSHSNLLETCEDENELIEEIGKFNLEIQSYLKVKDFLSPSPYVTVDSSVEEALDIMKKEGLEFLPVLTKDNTVAGHVDLSDILKSGFPEYVLRLTAFSFVKEFEPIKHFWENENQKCIKDYTRISEDRVIHENASYVEMLFRIVKYHFRNMIVTDKNNKYLGIITYYDIIHKMLRP